MRARVDRVKFVMALTERDLTVKRLAELTGVSRATLSSVKSGKGCSQKTAARLVRVLGQDIIEERS